MKKIIEAEGGELVLRDTEGNVAIIPANQRIAAQQLLKSGCNECVSNIVRGLPKMADYAQEGTLVEKKPEVSEKVSNYRQNIANFYNKAKESAYKDDADNDIIHKTPYPKPGEGTPIPEGYNCIRGVCTLINEASPGTLSGITTGNITWGGKASEEGFYSPKYKEFSEEGFYRGDIIQYGTSRKNYVKHRTTADAQALQKSMTPATENDFIGTHATVVLDIEDTPEGKVYTIGDNRGNEEMQARKFTHEQLLDRFKGYSYKFKAFRYNPEKVREIQDKQSRGKLSLEGQGPYSHMFEPGRKKEFNFEGVPGINLETLEADKYFDGSMADSDAVNKLMKIYSEGFNEVGRISGLEPNTLEKLVKKQIGIAAQETGFGQKGSYLLKEPLPNTIIPALRKNKQIEKILDKTGIRSKPKGWMHDYYDKNIEGVADQYSLEEFKELVKEEISTTGETYKDPFKAATIAPASSGWWQQKEPSLRGKHLGYDAGFMNTRKQAMSSLLLAVDNYHSLKDRYPDASEDKLIDLTTLMHSAPASAFLDRYVKYYYDNPEEEVNYISKVNNFVNAITKDKE